jgi:hypothetical protein
MASSVPAVPPKPPGLSFPSAGAGDPMEPLAAGAPAAAVPVLARVLIDT